ncbi:MAG TPA: carboxylating nicotinate-nucleotide diphosphorylase [Streptosporangiaceae bacterium]|nr:carboxylating nicotinate-nucleotide diphosphorylase [Streptosporangiaceae bacterium]
MPEIPAELAAKLQSAGLDPAVVLQVIQAALAEDLADGPDVTTAATIPPAEIGTADIVARRPGVVAGLHVAEAVFHVACAGDGSAAAGQRAAAPIVRADRYHVSDGQSIAVGDTLMTVTGPLHVILTAERTALNLLCHMSGIATLTARWADAVAGTKARIRDTRKTLPGLRALEKYAVRCGGGVNHRMSLSDAALIKDNHVAGAGSVTAAFDAVGKMAPDLPVEVECDTLAQVDEAVAAGADLILLDNFSVADMAEAVRRTAGLARLEASGGLLLEDAATVAAAGVDYLAVGALTHSAPALDIGLDVRDAAGSGR